VQRRISAEVLRVVSSSFLLHSLYFKAAAAWYLEVRAECVMVQYAFPRRTVRTRTKGTGAARRERACPRLRGGFGRGAQKTVTVPIYPFTHLRIYEAEEKIYREKEWEEKDNH